MIKKINIYFSNGGNVDIIDQVESWKKIVTLKKCLNLNLKSKEISVKNSVKN